MSRTLTRFEEDCAGKFCSVVDWGEMELSVEFTAQEQRIIENAIQQFDCRSDVARFKRFYGRKGWSLVFDRQYIKLAYEQLDTDEESRPEFFKSKCRRIARHTPFARHWHHESVRDYCVNEGLKFNAAQRKTRYSRLHSFVAYGSEGHFVDDIEFQRDVLDRRCHHTRVVERELWPHWMLAAAFGVNTTLRICMK